MPKRDVTPPGSRKAHHQTEQAASAPGAGSEWGEPRPSSPFAALALRRTRFSSVPLVHIKHAEHEGITFPASVELPRRHVTFYSDVDSDSSLSGGGLCSMSDTMESFKDVGGSPSSQPPSVRIKHLTRNSDGSSRFPKLDECAHFHYDNVELGPINVSVCEAGDEHGPAEVRPGDWWFCLQVSSNGRSWQVRRSLDNFQMLDRQLHRCVYDRKFSLLQEISSVQPQQPEDAVRTMLTQYLERFSQLAGSLINCGPVLNWLELDNRGNRLIVTDEAAINTPAVAAAYVIKRYASQATDEISLEVGDIISVIDMPPPEESSWWRGKKGFQVGFFPCECVEIIGDKVPQSIKIPKSPSKPVLRKHGKLIAFFRSFLLSRPSRRKLKQSGILKERVFGCDLGEHLMNTGRDIPLVLKCCTEFIEQHGIVDGIYRLSGVTSNIQKLRLAFDEDRVPNLLDEAILQDIHCVASLLKMYFRELPNPLLTFHLYDKFVSAVQAEEDLRLLKLRDVVQQLPPPHYRSLEYLMRHLSKVAAYGFQTGMTPKNVAIVWAPNLLRSRDIENGGVGALHVVGVQAVLTEYLIRYTDIIFSEKMPIFPTPSVGEETPKKTRPKSLAISTPTKLLSLEEARTRALMANLPGEQQKFIDVGGGEENLPVKYHTVIELPARRRSMGKGKKSPSGWRSFFSRGWHTTSGRRKSRRSRTEGQSERPKIGSPIFLEHSSLALQDKAITESDVSHNTTKRLRTVKSAEALFPLSSGFSQKENAFSPTGESISSSHESSCGPSFECSTSSTSIRFANYYKHVRSTSHDSYFEHIIEYPNEEDLEEVDQNKSKMSTCLNGEPNFTLPRRKETSAENEESPRRSKVAQKQKLVCLETEASSPKLQKLSLKRLYHTLSSPPMVKKKDNCKVEAHEVNQDNVTKVHCLTFEKSHELKHELKCSSSDGESSADFPQKSWKDLPTSVPLTESTNASTVLKNFCDKDCASVEMHGTLPELASLSVENGTDYHDADIGDFSNGSILDESDNLFGASMEATISDSVSLSQLLSFNSKECDQASPPSNAIRIKQSEGSLASRDGSLNIPDSPTGDNVSELPSSADSEAGGSANDVSKPVLSNDSSLMNVQNEHFTDKTDSLKAVQSQKMDSLNAIDKESVQSSDDQLVNQTKQLQISPEVATTRLHEIHLNDKASLSSVVQCISPLVERPLSVSDSFVENIILSPPANFVDDKKFQASVLQAQKGSLTNASTPEARGSAKSPGTRSIERSPTQVHDICPKFVSGIAVFGSFSHELFKAPNDLNDSFGVQKKRFGGEKVSPISPNEDSKRKFESEIGRLIVRDRQMKLEMEQMKAERQKCKVEKTSVSDVDKNKTKSEKKFADAIDFRKSPVKCFDNERKKEDSEDLLKTLKDGMEEKRLPEFGHSRYLKMDSKPSVKELLSKFEGNKQSDASEFSNKSHRDSTSSPKQSSVFTNVQVINHNFPLSSSKSFSSANPSSKDNQSFHVREHIFQTECVVRFPHPKTSGSNFSSCSDSPKNSSLKNDVIRENSGSNSWISGQSDQHSEVSNRTSFSSLDNMTTSSVQKDTSFNRNSSFLETVNTAQEDSRSRCSRTKYSKSSLQNGKGEEKTDTMSEEMMSPGKPFSSFKDTYNRANKLTSQMRTEFFRSGFSQEKLDTGSSPLSDDNLLLSGGRFSRSPPDTTRRRHAQTRQRPKSVPPPVCRLSVPADASRTYHSKGIPPGIESSQSVPKTPCASLSNGKESTQSSQSYERPVRIRDRAAIFERSLSFSGYADKRPFSSSQNAQSGTSAT